MMYHHNRIMCASSKNLILVVASDPDLGFILAMILREEIPHEVLVADGKDAIELCHLITPRLVLLDEQLPGIYPLTLYERLCRIAANRQIPGLLLGASQPQDDCDRQHLHWIKKPFHWEKLLQTVKVLLDDP